MAKTRKAGRRSARKSTKSVRRRGRKARGGENVQAVLDRVRERLKQVDLNIFALKQTIPTLTARDPKDPDIAKANEKLRKLKDEKETLERQSLTFSLGLAKGITDI